MAAMCLVAAPARAADIVLLPRPAADGAARAAVDGPAAALAALAALAAAVAAAVAAVVSAAVAAAVALAAAVAAAVAAAPVAAAVAAADKLLLKKGSSGEWAGRRTNFWQGRFKPGALLFFAVLPARGQKLCF